MPPRWMWPSVVARVSMPVVRSISRGQPLADAAQPRPAERRPARARSRCVHRRPGRSPRRRPPAVRGRASCASQHPVADLLHGGLLLRDQDGVGAGGHAGVQGDPADVAAHDLGDHAAVVGFARWCAAGPSPRWRSAPRCRIRRCSRWRRGRCRWSWARRRSWRPASVSRLAPARVPSPPMAMTASMPSRSSVACDVLRAAARRRTGWCARCRGWCRPAWRCRGPRARGRSMKSPSTTPRQPSRKPTNSWP